MIIDYDNYCDTRSYNDYDAINDDHVNDDVKSNCDDCYDDYNCCLYQ